MGQNPGCIFKRRAIAISVVVTAVLSAQATSADISNDDALIAGAKLCTSYLPRHERQYGIPIHLLAAIASTESGRYNKKIGMTLPWPWTINVEGKGYFFDTKEEAITKVKELQARGYQSIDVGCMQVNLHHHPNAFMNLDQAFDPGYNVAYAAAFLKQNFNDERSWRKATADYHSRTPYFGEQYARLVFNEWGRIINKVSDAQAGRTTLPTATAKLEPVNLSSDWSSKKNYRHSYHALHMHSISVEREHGVLVVRPEHDEAEAKTAPHEDSDKFVIRNVKYVQNKDGFEPTRTAQNTAPRVIQPQQAYSAQNAQNTAKSTASSKVDSDTDYTMPSHVVHVNDSLIDSRPVRQNTGGNVFVFEN